MEPDALYTAEEKRQMIIDKWVKEGEPPIRLGYNASATFIKDIDKQDLDQIADPVDGQVVIVGGPEFSRHIYAEGSWYEIDAIEVA